MKKGITKKKIIIVVLFIIIAGAGIKTERIHKRMLKEPIYYRNLVEHYLPSIADSVTETSTTRLMYITNFNDKREISNISFDGHKELSVQVSSGGEMNVGIYKIRTAILYYEWDQREDAVLPSVAEINTIHVEYSDGSTQTVDIGRLCLYSGESKEHLLEAVSCTPLDESERVQSYETKQEFQIKGLSESTKKALEKEDIVDSMSLTYDGREIINDTEPTDVKSGKIVEFSMRIKGEGIARLFDLNCDYDCYEVEPQILLSDKEGNEYFTTVYNPPVMIQLSTEKEIQEYLKRRG